MGVIRDIIDTIRDVKTLGSEGLSDSLKTKKYSSISKRSLEGTLQFPVLVTKSLDIETLQMVTKALERQFASFIQVSLSMNPFLNLQTDKDAVGYLRKFHQNSNVKSDIFDYMNLGGDVLENYNAFTDETKQVFLFATVYEGATAKVVAANKEQLQSIFENVRHDILNNKFIPRSLYRFKNDNLNYYYNGIVTEASKNKNDKSKSTNITNNNNMVIGGDFGSNNVTTSNFGDIKTSTVNIYSSGTGKSFNLDSSKMKFELPNELLKNNDARKANELVPTTMHVRTILLNEKGENQGTMDFIIGIKATMHPISSEEIVTNLLNAVKNKGKFFNFIRWTSGEISFFKDFLFNIKEIKDDVTSRSAGSSPWWIALKRRRALAKLKNALMLPKQILPNATIVVSKEEIEYIRSEFGYDLMDLNVLKKIMDTYFLLGFVVVDNSTQIVHFLFDGHNDFQSVSFSGLENATRGGSSSDIKEVLKLIQRV
jgi:hypothetical protein